MITTTLQPDAQVKDICDVLSSLITACYNETEKVKVTKVIDETISNFNVLIATAKKEGARDALEEVLKCFEVKARGFEKPIHVQATNAYNTAKILLKNLDTGGSHE